MHACFVADACLRRCSLSPTASRSAAPQEVPETFTQPMLLTVVAPQCCFCLWLVSCLACSQLPMAVGPGGLAEAQARIVPHEPEEEGQRQTEFFTFEVSSTKLVAAWQELRAAIPDSCVLPLLVECLRYCSRRTALGSGSSGAGTTDTAMSSRGNFITVFVQAKRRPCQQNQRLC